MKNKHHFIDIAGIWEMLHEIDIKLDHHIGLPRHVCEDNDQECTCEARKREEEANMVFQLKQGGWARAALQIGNSGAFVYRWVTHPECIHCKLHIRRSLLD